MDATTRQREVDIKAEREARIARIIATANADTSKEDNMSIHRTNRLESPNALTLAEAIRHPDFLFVRAHNVGGTTEPNGRCGVIHRNGDSPTGKLQVATGLMVDALALSAAPLSPTEMLDRDSFTSTRKKI